MFATRGHDHRALRLQLSALAPEACDRPPLRQINIVLRQRDSACVAMQDQIDTRIGNLALYR